MLATRAGFTLVEVLLVLALLALLAAVFIPGVNSILRDINARGPDQLLSEAMLAARHEALATGRVVELRYHTEARQLWWSETAPRAEPLPAGMEVSFLPLASGSSILLGGQLAEAQEPLRRVRFFPDGTCDAFRVSLKAANAAPRLFVVDPWTCALSPLPTTR
ncbi:MAG: prepilin-type N-terminal cleavage/methylation domain-containing protein [Candidatus Didemnitutus sp.]|nr:prepilin-type N-terminal cleavage/methylation domain-containing protein [Candidatus Didemnitutus sp.]